MLLIKAETSKTTLEESTSVTLTWLKVRCGLTSGNVTVLQHLTLKRV